ncbi:MAG: hypothetical protein DKM50_13505 [Candidatus Margulisiibacteriota bacterium]|nr:MAG: hypothetical protein A2X42_04110 [Candidatus Margulisbacteria bacterium GWF2_38_17]OGI07169.1 MAG: hypothetical protein A2X41_06180 [Candidatus Margulisbacteria bacterium GWE2_39_32]PZM77266.1 MAG: hypothetical protein DKM50_13505 [Candidatus Margulisiibacteriota bacterium]HAR64390.1 hypothetical protein [Candidatus Margulisiibacteriota bacterium]HCT84467.1 hypothetical protein [Candidatus Margulisiibacteriota bacterium]
MKKKSEQMSFFDVSFSGNAETKEDAEISNNVEEQAFVELGDALEEEIEAYVDNGPLIIDEKDSSVNTFVNGVYYEVFISDTCPSCPEMKEFAEKSLLPGMGKVINVSVDLGATELATNRGIERVPTFLLIDGSTNEIVGKAFTVEETFTMLNRYIKLGMESGRGGRI